ncbi:MAG TPA: NAD(P)-dependent oxidoreductase [Xanthobacteraceae bacterium]|jgi:phosphoglycerate dehydrogenase-like enzyme|nr:NAD(P)-dependent oxidoreductase [Xanthobacteraceae bacterium]
MKVVMYPYRRDDAIIGLTGDFPELDWAVVSSTEELAREIPNATILVTSNRVCTPAFGEALRAHANALRWMFFSSSGVERGVAAGIPTGVRVTNSTGVKATMVAEHAMTLLLALLRQLPECQALQRAHLYRRQETNGKLKTLEDATVCVIGRGAIGREIVRKLKAFDAQPIAVSRTATDPGDLAAVYPRERITEGLTRADAVIICTAGDESSFRLIGEREIAAMKPTAYIVNVARGEIINEAALVAALAGGRLAGAGLDVNETEPLPADSPLWDMPNVILSPHVAGGGSTGYFMHRNLFKQNLERLRAGQPLLNEINISNRP